jgi:hypothetical protein
VVFVRAYETFRAYETYCARFNPGWCYRVTSQTSAGPQLLALNLSPAQREQYSKHFDFDVIGGDTGGRYRIRHGCAMNVQQLDQNGREVQLLCFAPRDRLPVGDVMLAQKLALELFETDVIRVANRSPAWHTALDAHLN